eukprot:167678-Rhodomonas_salina.1
MKAGWRQQPFTVEVAVQQFQCNGSTVAQAASQTRREVKRDSGGGGAEEPEGGRTQAEAEAEAAPELL